MSQNKHLLKYVIPSLGYELICCFKDGQKRLFKMNAIFDKYPDFNILKEDGLFFDAYTDMGGAYVKFNDDLYISSDTLFKESKKYDQKKENKKFIKDVLNSLKAYRKQEKITQKQLSVMSNIPQSGIARIESGCSDVQIGTLLNYLTPLGLTLRIEPAEVPNKQTLMAMQEADDISKGKKDEKTYSSVLELRKDLGLWNTMF